MTYRLQALRLTMGWSVRLNQLYEVDPADLAEEEFPAPYFIEDLLWMQHEERNRTLDVGWYPDGDIKGGEYALVLYEGDYGGKLLFELRTRDRLKLVAEIERVSREVSEGHL